ncbi:MAG: pyridoxal-dependent decarboxylase [Pseudomonadales bacterium]|nr:pyridoxal-dependent decarboxylase [Pseudomonadales bacterium]
MSDQAYCGPLSPALQRLGQYLDRFNEGEQGDAGMRRLQWRAALQRSLPQSGIGLDKVLQELGEQVIPNGSAVPLPGFTSFITTGATNMGVLASLAAMVASPQRIGLTAFQQLEELSLNWLVELFHLPAEMKGVYSSGGSTANLLALGAARQRAFELRGHDCGRDGVPPGGRIFATAASHRTIHRAAAVLGMGRESVLTVKTDQTGRMCPRDLALHIERVLQADLIPVAIVANAGSTSTGAIDPLQAIAQVADRFDLWLHVDGAYGLPGILDERVRPLYTGIDRADSVVVDSHKWLGAPVGIGATLVKDRSLLLRAFTQGASDYLEGSFAEGLDSLPDSADGFVHSLDSMGIPYSDFGVELSSPARGAVVWALLREIGAAGMAARIRRHNDMARSLAEQVEAHPRLELLQAPTLSICCFRYRVEACDDLNALNRQLHRRLIHRGKNLPSTAMIDGQLAIRPCFIGARTDWVQVDDLLQDVVSTGDALWAELVAAQTK